MSSEPLAAAANAAAAVGEALGRLMASTGRPDLTGVGEMSAASSAAAAAAAADFWAGA